MTRGITKLNPKSTSINSLAEAYSELIFGWNATNLTAVKEFRAVGLDNNNNVVCKFALVRSHFGVNVNTLLDAVKQEKATRVVIAENALMGSILPRSNKRDFVVRVNTYGQKKGLRVIDQLILNNRSYYSLFNTGF